jgi:hypothetical protein
MKLRLPRFARNLVSVKGDLPKLAIGGAWLFAVGSLFPLLWLLTEGGNGAVFQTHTARGAHAIPLLHYSGVLGAMLIWAELLAVSGAFLLTVAPRVPGKFARIGHVVLLGWSALWTLGTWRLATLDPGFWTVQALFLSALSGCTVYRAWRNWNPHSASAKPANDASTVPADDHSSNYFSDEVEQPPTGSARQQIVQALERGKDAAVAASRKAVIAFKTGIHAARDNSAKT